MRYSDTDALGHISSGSYVTFMQVGRLEFFDEIKRRTGYDEDLVIANITVDYLRECFFGDAIEVVSWCSHIGRKSLKISCEIFANNTLVATGSAVNVGFNGETRQSQALPDSWAASSYSPGQ